MYRNIYLPAAPGTTPVGQTKLVDGPMVIDQITIFNTSDTYEANVQLRIGASWADGSPCGEVAVDPAPGRDVLFFVGQDQIIVPRGQSLFISLDQVCFVTVGGHKSPLLKGRFTSKLLFSGVCDSPAQVLDGPLVVEKVILSNKSDSVPVTGAIVTLTDFTTGTCLRSYDTINLESEVAALLPQEGGPWFFNRDQKLVILHNSGELEAVVFGFKF
jgi:hypothetical protein